MTTGFQIYIKSKGSDTFKNGGLHNWFYNIEDAIARKKSLENAWNKYGVEYIIVACAE